MNDMDYYTDFKEYGWQCNLVKPFSGYYRGTVIGKEDYRYAVQFSSGAVGLFYADEIYFD